MKEVTRRALFAAATVLVLAADSWVTLRLSGGKAPRAASAPAYSEATADPIGKFRLEREQLRARQEAQLNEVIYSASDDDAAQARRQLLDMLSRAEAETTLEGVLQSRGFEDALVTVSANSANVLLRRETLTQRESAVILELVMRETGLTGGNVKIIPVK